MDPMDMVLVTATLDMDMLPSDTLVPMAMLPQPQVLELLSVDMEHQLPLELMCHMVMLPAETMLLILLDLSILPREKLMLSQRLMLSMDMDTTTLDTATLVTTTLDTATLGSQPTPDQLLLSPELPLQLFPDQLSLLSPELLHQLSPVSQLQLFLDQL